MKNKGFFASHAKSCAVIASLGIHAILLALALSFVAVTMIQRNEVNFEAREIKRPKMNLRRLQVPVNLKKPPQQPRLRKTIVLKPNVSKIMPDIKMPEIIGVKGAVGAGSGGFGNGASLGFSMPEIELFGIKGKGEKVCIVLDSSPLMMYDEMGGIPAYTIIKDELVRILDELPSFALFNIFVYDMHRTYTIFPGMVPANSSNVAKVKQWIEPLNAVHPDMGSNDYGVDTLGEGGQMNSQDVRVGLFQRQFDWYQPAMLSMRQQADTVFLLTCGWGNQYYYKAEFDETWNETSDGRRWKECYEKAKEKLAEENKERIARGEPPRVVSDDPWALNATYFPEIVFPPSPPVHYHTEREMVEAMLQNRNIHNSNEVGFMNDLQQQRSKKSINFSFNVIHFTPRQGGPDARFKKVTGKLNGAYKTIAGLEAIQSSVSSQD